MRKERYEKPVIEASEHIYQSLRTCLDPESKEWSQTTLQKKIELLKHYLAKGHSLQELVIDYRSFHIAHRDMEVAHRAMDGLMELLSHFLRDKRNYQVIVER